MFNSRLRQAELALADERLDEAFALAQTPDVQDNRRGQQLVGQIARAFALRAKGHYLADRFGDALADCDRGAKLAGNLPELAEVKAAVVETIQKQQSQQRQQNQAIAVAKELIGQGQLSSVQRILTGDGMNSPHAAKLLDDVQDRRSTLEAALVAIKAAMSRDDVETALEELATARGADPDDRRLKELERAVSQSLQLRMTHAINDGRLDLASAFADRLSTLTAGLETSHLLRLFGQFQQVRGEVDNGHAREAREIVRRLIVDFPDAKWLGAAAEQLKQACDALDELKGGPIGRLAGALPARSDSPTLVPPRKVGPPPLPAQSPNQSPVQSPVKAAASLAARFMLQVDGAGCYLVLRNSLVTIGPVSSSKQPDVGLVADPNTPLITVERSEDDYFIRGESVIVGNRPVGNGMLLHGGDRVALSPRCQLTFVQPNPASTTAALDLTGCRFPRGDVRRAILLDREIVIGPGPSAHVRLDSMTEPVILNLRDGRMFCETRQPITVNGGAIDRVMGIQIGQTVRVGELAFVVTAA